MKRCVGFLLMVVVLTGAGAQETLLSVSGTLGPGDRQRSNGAWQDTYSFTVREGTLVEVVAFSEEFDSYIDASLPGGLVVSNDDYVGLNGGFVRRIGATGVATVTVSPLFAGAEGRYRLEARTLGNAAAVALGGERSGRFPAGDGTVRATFPIAGQRGERVVISAQAEGFDPLLTVVSETGDALRATSRSAGAARLSYLFEEDGTLFATVAGVGDDVRGSWTVSVEESVRSILASFEGRIDLLASERAYDGTPFASHSFTGVAGQSVEIVLESSQFDTVLYVSDSQGRSLVRNDDAGSGSDSLATVAVPDDGTLEIFVTPFFDGAGRYRLTVYGEPSQQ